MSQGHTTLFGFGPVALLLLVLTARGTPPPSPRPAAATEDSLAGVKVASDLDHRLSRYAPLEVPLELDSFPAEDRALLRKLVEACDIADEIYWRQNTEDGIEWRERVRASASSQREALLRYLRINGGRFDLLDHEKAFLGSGERPPGGAYYPADLTKQMLDAYLAAHPEEREKLEGANSVVRRTASGLEVVPDHAAWPDLVEALARELEQAASLSRYPTLATYLRRRAADLRTDDYFQSDSLWIDLHGSPYDLVIGPYETYGDGLLGVKAAYTGVLMKVDQAASEELRVYQRHIPQMEQFLPSPPALKAKKAGASTPTTVVDTLYRAGDGVPGYQFVAFNLPNDARVNEARGSRKVIHRNFLAARMRVTVHPIAERLLPPEVRDLVTDEGYFEDTLFHEISHGLGAQTVVGTDRPINAALSESYSALEEARADVCGLVVGEYCVRQGLLPPERRRLQLAAFLGGALRSIRFGKEAHAVAARMHLNLLMREGALKWDESQGRFAVDFDKMQKAVSSYARDLLVIEATGDAARARELVASLGRMSPPLEAAVARVADLPIDFQPVYSLVPASAGDR
jgi:hypothetical protein